MAAGVAEAAGVAPGCALPPPDESPGQAAKPNGSRSAIDASVKFKRLRRAGRRGAGTEDGSSIFFMDETATGA